MISVFFLYIIDRTMTSYKSARHLSKNKDQSVGRKFAEVFACDC